MPQLQFQLQMLHTAMVADVASVAQVKKSQMDIYISFLARCVCYLLSMCHLYGSCHTYLHDAQHGRHSKDHNQSGKQQQQVRLQHNQPHHIDSLMTPRPLRCRKHGRVGTGYQTCIRGASLAGTSPSALQSGFLPSSSCAWAYPFCLYVSFGGRGMNSAPMTANTYRAHVQDLQVQSLRAFLFTCH